MKGQPETAKQNGRILRPPYFIHANRGPLAPTTPATLVQIIQCQLHADGRADVLVLPTAYVWLEKLWVEKDDLIQAQCLKMPQRVTLDMIQLARQEAMVQVMGALMDQFGSSGSEDEFLEHPGNESDFLSEED